MEIKEITAPVQRKFQVTLDENEVKALIAISASIGGNSRPRRNLERLGTRLSYLLYGDYMYKKARQDLGIEQTGSIQLNWKGE